MSKDKFWFQIDTELLKKLASGQFINYSITNINGFPPVKFNGNWNKSVDAKVWKSHYFDKFDGYDQIVSEYVHHIKQHSGYYVRLPSYYRSLFDILN